VTATIAEVAARAGVSTATVSRVLSGSVAARPDTRDRVLAAARELDYRPSAIARALKRRETRTLGLLVTDVGNPFYPQVVAAVEAAAHELGYGIVLANGGNEVARELEHLDLLAERRVDGLIVASAHVTHEHLGRLERARLPVVLVNADVQAAGIASVSTDHRLGARLATAHLVDLGHRRIGHISAPASHAAARARLAGVRDGTASVDDPVVVEGNADIAGGATAVAALLAAGVTAIVAYNDLTAIGALRALHAAGRTVPDQVSVVGFDDIEMAAWTDPPLTTVRQPIPDLGRWAVERLVAGLRGSPAAATAEHTVLAPSLVLRDSTRSVARG
jgi:LacI family transcriptional regulator